MHTCFEICIYFRTQKFLENKNFFDFFNNDEKHPKITEKQPYLSYTRLPASKYGKVAESIGGFDVFLIEI